MSIPTGAAPAEDPALLANSDGQILSASVTLLVLPTVFVALRLCSRHISGAGFWWDDLTVVLGFIFSWGGNITNILASQDSLGHHKEALTLPNLISFFRHLYAFTIQYSLAMTFVKFSVVLFQYRIFPIISFRRITIAFGAFVLAFGLASTIVFIVPCTPISDFWLTLIGILKTQQRGQCISMHKFLLANGSINTVTDFALLLLPLPLLWRLRASKLQKCILTGIFVTGLVVTGVGMVRLVVIARYHGNDVTYDFVPTCIWTAAEPSIAVICTCLASLRPLFVRIFRLGAPRPATPRQEDYFSSSSNLASTWRSASNIHVRSFNRLPENGKSRSGSVSNGVTIHGGKGADDEEVVELGSPQEEEELETPMNRIRAKTTVVLTVSERVDWQDDLY